MNSIKASFLKHRTLIQFALSLIFVALVFLTTSMSWLVFFVFVPLLYVINRIEEYSQSQTVKAFYIYGLLYSCIAMFWVVQTTPTSWTDIEPTTAVIGKIFILVISCITLALGFLTMGYFISRLRASKSLLLLTLPLLWVLNELVRALAFSVLNYGPGGTIGFHHNFGSLGLAIANTPLVYLSRFIGLYGLTAVAIAVNISLYLLLSKQYKYAVYIITPIIFLNLIAFMMYLPGAETRNVAVVHLSEDDSLDTWDAMYPTQNPDLVVMPEYSLFFENERHQKIAEEYFPGDAVVTTVSQNSNPSDNTITYYTSELGIFNQQNKAFLAPVGESMPYVVSGIFRLLNMGRVIDTFNETQQVRKGETKEYMVSVNGIDLGSLACSGILHLTEYGRLSRQGADILTNSASLSLLQDPSFYNVHERYLARFHAVSNARPFLLSSRSGSSYIIDSNGTIVIQKTGDSGIIESPVKLVPRRTIFSMFSF